MTGQEVARAAGYIDALKEGQNKRLLYLPSYRFAYDAGRKDGSRARGEIKEYDL